jgi:hypothetical protein
MYLVSATPTKLLIEFLWNFTVVVHNLQMCMKEYHCCLNFRRGDNSTYTFPKRGVLYLVSAAPPKRLIGVLWNFTHEKVGRVLVATPRWVPDNSDRDKWAQVGPYVKTTRTINNYCCLTYYFNKINGNHKDTVWHLSTVLGNVKKNPYIINQNHIFSKHYCEVISG